MKHSATEMTPKEARKRSNELTVKLHLAKRLNKIKYILTWIRETRLKYSGRESPMKKKGSLIGLRMYIQLKK